jgi:hypothetical protein
MFMIMSLRSSPFSIACLFTFHSDSSSQLLPDRGTRRILLSHLNFPFSVSTSSLVHSILFVLQHKLMSRTKLKGKCGVAMIQTANHQSKGVKKKLVDALDLSAIVPLIILNIITMFYKQSKPPLLFLLDFFSTQFHWQIYVN